MGCREIIALSATSARTVDFQKPIKAYEVREVALELPVVVVVLARDGGFLDRAVHTFDLTIGPRMPNLGQSVLNAVLATNRVTVSTWKIPSYGTIEAVRSMYL